jgi:hypothetical protein
VDDALLDALRPRGLRERLRLRTVGGWTAAQVYTRLADDARATLAGERWPVEVVHRALLALVEAGRVHRARVRWAMELNTKGMRGMVVDVFRLA